MFRGVPGFLEGVPGCSGFFTLFRVFQGVPGCPGVPCSGVPLFRCSGVPVFLELLHALYYLLLLLCFSATTKHFDKPGIC